MAGAGEGRQKRARGGRGGGVVCMTGMAAAGDGRGGEFRTIGSGGCRTRDRRGDGMEEKGGGGVGREGGKREKEGKRKKGG